MPWIKNSFNYVWVKRRQYPTGECVYQDTCRFLQCHSWSTFLQTVYLWAAREAVKEKAMEPSHSQTTDKASKSRAMSFFPLWKLKGTEPTKTSAIRAEHLEEEGSEEEAGAKSEDPDGIEGVTEEFIVCLARVVKETQNDEKWCYHCSSTDHIIHKCLLVKTSRSATHLNQQEGMVPEKGTWTPQVKVTKLKATQEGMPKA